MIFGDKRKSEQRDRIIQFKKTFGSEDGRAVLIELMNKYHILEDHKGDPYKEGQRSVVLFIVQQTNMNMEQFDKLLRGELTA